MTDILETIKEIATITPLLGKIIDNFKNLRKKSKDDVYISVIDSNIQELSQKLSFIKNGAWSINAYLELYGNALNLYTTADDFIKTILNQSDIPNNIFEVTAQANYSNLTERFDIGFNQYISTYGIYLDKVDENSIKIYIDNLREKLGEGKGQLTIDRRNQLIKVISEIARISNTIRGLSRGRLLSLTMELQKIGG